MTKTYSPSAIVKKFLRNENLSEEEGFYFEHSDWLNQSAYGLSVAAIDENGDKKEMQKSSFDCFDESSDLINNETIFNIASLSKPITVATILRMMESEEFAEYFPRSPETNSSLETKLSNFYQYLEDRYPQLDYIKDRLRTEDPRISLKDLITHTSGIANFDSESFDKILRFQSKELLAKPADGKFLDLPRKEEGVVYGEYFYSDVGYELLGMIISSIATNKRKEAVTCGQMMREMVIDRLDMKNTFTPDELGFDEMGRVIVIGKPDFKIARGYDCNYDGNLSESHVFRRCIATSAIYSTPLDLCKFAKAVFSGKTYAPVELLDKEETIEPSAMGGLFDKEDTVKLQNSFNVIQIDRIKNDKEEIEKIIKSNDQGSDCYGIGFMFWVNKDGGNKLYYHGAKTAGYSGWLGYRNGNTSCCLVSCQNLTTYFARAKLEEETSNKIIENKEGAHSRFCEINADLLAKYDHQDLLNALKRAKFDPKKTR